MLDTIIFDPATCKYPKPLVPLLPALDGVPRGLTFHRQAPWAPEGHFRSFTHGRYALREAYRIAGLGPGTTLLAPSYHCRTMIDPGLALGCNVMLYPVERDLAPDLDVVRRLAAESATPVRAVLATHFFGFPQDFSSLAAWCRSNGIVLVEDCAHALLCRNFRTPGIGEFGDFVTASPYKFLPSPDGGLLYAANEEHLKQISPRPQSLRQQVRGLSAALAGIAAQRKSAARCAAAANHIADAESPASAHEYKRRSGPSADYHPDMEGLAAQPLSEFIVRHTDFDFVASRRRANYQRWLDNLGGLANCRPLYSRLPDACIPYMLPLYIDRPHSQFDQMKRAGVPIWRWDSIAASGCDTANEYRLHLMHLPCHQSLSETQMSWLIAAVAKVSRGGTPLRQE